MRRTGGGGGWGGGGNKRCIQKGEQHCGKATRWKRQRGKLEGQVMNKRRRKGQKLKKRNEKP